jgi:diguanylate cyclase (GGDEF)-like protein
MKHPLEQRKRQQSKTNDGLEEEHQHTLELLAQQRHMLELLAHNAPLRHILSQALALLQNQRQHLFYAALLLNNGTLHRYNANLPPTVVLAFDHIALASIVKSHRASGPMIPIQIDLLDKELHTYHNALLSAQCRRCWTLPIHTVEGVLLAMLTIASHNDEALSQADLEYIAFVAHITTIAIEQHQRSHQLAYHVHHDQLTGLSNRVRFDDRLQQAIDHSRRSGSQVAVLLTDLDRFKHINDTLGHTIGDSLLRQVARRFEQCIRSTDTLARRGGDEFMLILPDVEGIRSVTRVANRLLEVLKTPFQLDGHELFITASIGISLYPHDGEDAATLQRHADTAMYRAKSLFRNSFRFFDPAMNAAALDRLRLESQLRRALERDELLLYYQPIVNVEGRLVGAEALLRWQHPELGLLAPSRFIPLAEETGLIVSIGEWCIRQACAQNRHWQQVGYAPINVSVNVSAIQFAQPDFASRVAEALDYSALDPMYLELELTESMLMGDHEETYRQLAQLRRLGIGLAIDDFGTGYSSLAYLQRLPISMLKIDRSFVCRLQINTGQDTGERAIINTIATLARHLHMSVVAEGVETADQAALLQMIGCNYYQGYFFSQPLPPDEFKLLLHEAQPFAGYFV